MLNKAVDATIQEVHALSDAADEQPKKPLQREPADGHGSADHGVSSTRFEVEPKFRVFARVK
jgi:hypothetical protein